MTRTEGRRLRKLLKAWEKRAAKEGFLIEPPVVTPSWAKTLFGVNVAITVLIAILGLALLRQPTQAPTLTAKSDNTGTRETVALNLTLPSSGPVATDATGQVRYYSAFFEQQGVNAADAKVYRPYVRSTLSGF